MKINDQFAGIKPGFAISTAAPSFTSNGNYIFFMLSPPTDNRLPKVNAVQVDVWNYKDSVLQSMQLLRQNHWLWSGTKKQLFKAVVSVQGRQVVQLEEKEDEMLGAEGIPGVSTSNDNFAIVSDKTSVTEYWWKSYPQKSSYLVSFKDGSRKLLNVNWNGNFYFFSPGGKYLTYFDGKAKAYFSYDLSSGKTVNISKDIPTSCGIENSGKGLRRGEFQWPVGLAGWLKDDKALLIYDNYDIWQVDPSATKTPINLYQWLRSKKPHKISHSNGRGISDLLIRRICC